MLWIVIIGIVIIVLVFATKGKKEECPECEVPEEEPCAELKKLAVYYNGKALNQSEVVKVPYNTKVEFKAVGLDITGTKDACINGSDIVWDKSCSCTYWETPTGVVNKVRVNNKTLNTKREVWIKHKNGVTFAWKVEVV